MQSILTSKGPSTARHCALLWRPTAVGLVDDDEGAGDAGGVMGDFVLRAARDRQPGIAQLNEVEAQHRVDRLGRVADRHGVEDGAAASDLFAKERGNGTERGIFPQVGEAGKLARRSRLSDARPAMTHADIAVVRAGFGKLDEPGMFAGRQERLLDQELNRQRRRAGALGRWWAGKPYPLGRHRRSPWGQAPACRAPSRRAGRAGSRATTGAQRARS